MITTSMTNTSNSTDVTGADASWRDLEPTDAQTFYLQKLCKKLKVKYVTPEDRGTASDLIDILKSKEVAC